MGLYAPPDPSPMREWRPGMIHTKEVDPELQEIERRYFMEADTLGIIEFNDFIRNDTQVENVLLPVRDGIMIVRKLGGEEVRK